MKTASVTARLARQTDPRIMKKTHRDNGAYASVGALNGELDYDCLTQHLRSGQPRRLLEFGRPAFSAGSGAVLLARSSSRFRPARTRAPRRPTVRWRPRAAPIT